MQRGVGNKIRTRFRKKGGAPFIGAAMGMGGGGLGMMMNKKLHAKAHKRMGMGGGGEKEKDTEVDQIAQQEKEASRPGKAPVNKKDE